MQSVYVEVALQLLLHWHVKQVLLRRVTLHIANSHCWLLML
jgi:hypothetical protein